MPIATSPARHTQNAAARTSSPPVCWLNLVCLDAPLVAIAWQWLFARTFGAELSFAARAALFLTAWLIYLADRFADNLSLGPRTPMSARQAFCFRHRHTWLVTLAIVGLAVGWVILCHLERDVFRVGTICGLAAIAYLAVNARSRIWRAVPMKEIVIGFLFAAGTMLVPVLRAPELPRGIVFLCAAFAALCALNCMSIAAWEQDLDLAQRKESLATSWPGLVRAVPIFCALLALATGAGSHSAQLATEVSAALIISALALGTLTFLRGKISRDVRTALADIVLLTPLVSVFIAWVR